MLMQAIEAEVEAFLAGHAGLLDQQGRRRLVRNGHAPERQIQTGIGPLEVRRPKVRDRGAAASGEPIRFSSAVLPAYLRRTRNLEELLPWLGRWQGFLRNPHTVRAGGAAGSGGLNWSGSSKGSGAGGLLRSSS